MTLLQRNFVTAKPINFYYLVCKLDRVQYPINPHYFQAADLIVTLCGDAKDHCPVTAPQTRSIHWPLLDPAQATGTPEQQLLIFRQVRDEIKQRILALASTP